MEAAIVDVVGECILPGIDVFMRGVDKTKEDVMVVHDWCKYIGGEGRWWLGREGAQGEEGGGGTCVCL